MRRALAPATLALWLAGGAAAGASCSVSVSPPAFGTYDPLGGPDVATGTVSVTCTIALTVQLAASAGGAGDPTTRAMTRTGGGALRYNLYVDSGRSTIWGDGTAGTSTITILLSAFVLSASANVYGAVPAHEDAPAGSYADTLTVTSSF